MPTVREMQAGMGMKSNNGPRYYLAMLERGGHIVRAGGAARTLQVTDAGHGAAA